MASVSFSKMPYEFLCLVIVPPNTSQILLAAFTNYAQESTKCLKPLSSTELVNLGHFRKMAAMQQGLEGPLWEREGKMRKAKKGQRGKVKDGKGKRKEEMVSYVRHLTRELKMNFNSEI
jgi:hypothetical protein